MDKRRLLLRALGIPDVVADETRRWMFAAERVYAVTDLVGTPAEHTKDAWRQHLIETAGVVIEATAAALEDGELDRYLAGVPDRDDAEVLSGRARDSAPDGCPPSVVKRYCESTLWSLKAFVDAQPFDYR